jgi:hypothetical protein
MATSDTKRGTQKLPKNFGIVKTYWQDYSLESSWGALSDDTTISFSIHSKMHFLNKPVLKVLTDSHWTANIICTNFLQKYGVDEKSFEEN